MRPRWSSTSRRVGVSLTAGLGVERRLRSAAVPPFTPATGADVVKPGETRRGYAFGASSLMGSLIQAMVGSFGGWGGRVNRVGFAA